MVSRAQKTRVGEWWWTVDRLMLLAIFILIGVGVILSFSAGPASAQRAGLPPFYFVEKHLIFLAPAIGMLVGMSFLTPRQVRRVSLVVFVGMWLALLATLFIGVEVKGARRWLGFFGFSVQPSEFIKPAFIVLTAWLMSERMKRADVPGNLLATVLLVSVIAILLLQPDFGQTMLVLAAWSALFFIASMSWMLVALLAAGGAGLLAAAYIFLPHVAGRINRFMTGQGDNYQVRNALESIKQGGWFGRGPGEGTVKRQLPDSHTDFIFSVAAEEFGIIACLALIGIIAFIVTRGLNHALKMDDPFGRLAVSGLIVLYGLQSAINISVNLQLIPAKGMTLPFISYGGSSMIAVAFGMGMVLALTRKRPRTRDYATTTGA